MKRHDDLPAHQLAIAVDRIIERADRPAALFTGAVSRNSQHSHAHSIRERLGINDRVHYGWRTGGKRNVSFSVADQILTRAGLLWWDVWNEDTVRRYAVVVSTYGWSMKSRNGQRRAYRYRKATHGYGDMGPDLVLLARVRDVWEPTALEVAA